MNSNVNRTDPACGTCRKKSRRCDRGRPNCERCISKGLTCEGYPTKFKIYDLANDGVKRRHTSTASRASKRRAPTDRNGKAEESTQAIARPSQESPSAITTSGSHTSPVSMVASFSSQSPKTRLELDHYSPRLEAMLSWDETTSLLRHFDTVLCDSLVTIPTCGINPFRTYILPLAYEHTSLLHAVLGLSACHSACSAYPDRATAALEHRLSAIRSLGSLLLKEECLGLNKVEEDLTLSIVLLSLMQDICESGISSHGTHLNGVAFLCSRIAAQQEAQTSFRSFLLAALSWFDVLRGFSGAEKLAFPPAVRNCVSSADNLSLETLVGCPKVIFHEIGNVLATAKAWMSGSISLEDFQEFLKVSEQSLYEWDMTEAVYPTSDPVWMLLGDAFRHASLLRILRFPDSFQSPCTHFAVKASVDRIMNICAQIPWDSPAYKRLLFPLFMAGADAPNAYQQHYTRICMDKIKQSTGFLQPAMFDLLKTVWTERVKAPDDGNVPWMEYTCSVYLKRQHDYLFF